MPVDKFGGGKAFSKISVASGRLQLSDPHSKGGGRKYLLLWAF